MGRHCDGCLMWEELHSQPGKWNNIHPGLYAGAGTEFEFELMILVYKLQIIWLSGFITSPNKILLDWTSWIYRISTINIFNLLHSSVHNCTGNWMKSMSSVSLPPPEDWLRAGLTNWPAHNCEPGSAWPVISTLSSFTSSARVTTPHPPLPPAHLAPKHWDYLFFIVIFRR